MGTAQKTCWWNYSRSIWDVLKGWNFLPTTLGGLLEGNASHSDVPFDFDKVQARFKFATESSIQWNEEKWRRSNGNRFHLGSKSHPIELKITFSTRNIYGTIDLSGITWGSINVKDLTLQKLMHLTLIWQP